MSEKDKGTTDDSIGRPALWREGRYQQAGEALDNSVAPDQPLDSKNPHKPAAAEEIAPGPVSTAVHLDEYTGGGDTHRIAPAKRKPR
jgi:hypothetical protein